MWYTYILKMADGEYYVGSINDLKRRLPVILEAYIAVKSEQTARNLEKYLKTSSGKTTLRKRILPDEAIT